MVGPTGDFVPMCRKCGGPAPFSAGLYGLCDRCRMEEEERQREKEKEEFDKKWKKNFLGENLPY